MQLENRGIPLPFSKRLWAAIACMGLGIFCAKAFVINPELYIGLSTVPPATTDYLWSFVAIVFAALFYHVLARRRYMPRAGEWIFGFCFGFANYFGTTLFAYDSWAFVNTALPLVNVVFKCLGQALVMVAALSWIAAGLERAGLFNRIRPPSPVSCALRRVLPRAHHALLLIIVAAVLVPIPAVLLSRNGHLGPERDGGAVLWPG